MAVSASFGVVDWRRMVPASQSELETLTEGRYLLQGNISVADRDVLSHDTIELKLQVVPDGVETHAPKYCRLMLRHTGKSYQNTHRVIALFDGLSGQGIGGAVGVACRYKGGILNMAVNYLKIPDVFEAVIKTGKVTFC